MGKDGDGRVKGNEMGNGDIRGIDEDDTTDVCKVVNQETEEKPLEREVAEAPNEDVAIDRDQKIVERHRMPTQADWDAHLTLHIPFQEWCPACAAGAGLGIQHRHDGSPVQYECTKLECN